MPHFACHSINFKKQPWHATLVCCTCLVRSYSEKTRMLIGSFANMAWPLAFALFLLKTRLFMHGLPWIDLDYCCYCNWGYRKRTRLWTNSGFMGKLCGGPGVCPNIEGKRHRSTAQQGRNKTPTGLHGEIHSTRALYRIPPALCEELEATCRIEP